ncbi:hypothetical protein B0H19DRAFT_1200560 [Mycena capillaripes]|nr:hypothetical protein B0H19DRAFT_1200560 [Mycena capillaripes]
MTVKNAYWRCRRRFWSTNLTQGSGHVRGGHKPILYAEDLGRHRHIAREWQSALKSA